MYFHFVVEGAYVRDCRGLGLCKVGIVGWSAGNEYVGASGSLMTGWGRMEGESEGWGREWVRRAERVLGEGSNRF
jgi:hypothetical protein